MQTAQNHPQIIHPYTGSDPAELSYVWQQLTHDDGLSIAALAWHLRDLDDFARRESIDRNINVISTLDPMESAPAGSSFRRVYIRRTSLLAAGFVGGEARIRQALDGRGFGGATEYVNDVTSHFDKANTVLCRGGAILC